MSKTLYKAAALEARLAKLAGAEWASDDEAESEKKTKGDKGKDFVAVKGAQQQRKPEAPAAAPTGPSGGVIYMGHIPHGFFEEQMRGFLGQFGDIQRLRLSRSKKTAKTRGYAFVEFASQEVASVVADTMNGYYLEGRKLVCHVVDPKDIHKDLFVGANKQFQKISWRKKEREKSSRPKTREAAKHCLTRLLKNESKKRQRLVELGIDYDFPGFAADVERVNEAVSETTEKPAATSVAAIPPTTQDAKRKRPRKEEAAVTEEETKPNKIKKGEPQVPKSEPQPTAVRTDKKRKEPPSKEAKVTLKQPAQDKKVKKQKGAKEDVKGGKSEKKGSVSSKKIAKK